MDFFSTESLLFSMLLLLLLLLLDSDACSLSFPFSLTFELAIMVNPWVSNVSNYVILPIFIILLLVHISSYYC